MKRTEGVQVLCDVVSLLIAVSLLKIGFNFSTVCINLTLPCQSCSLEWEMESEGSSLLTEMGGAFSRHLVLLLTGKGELLSHSQVH